MGPDGAWLSWVELWPSKRQEHRDAGKGNITAEQGGWTWVGEEGETGPMSDKGGCNQVIASDKTEEEKQKKVGREECWKREKEEEAAFWTHEGRDSWVSDGIGRGSTGGEYHWHWEIFEKVLSVGLDENSGVFSLLGRHVKAERTSASSAAFKQAEFGGLSKSL